MTYDDVSWRHWRAAKPLTVGAAQATAGTVLENGPGELVGWSLFGGSAVTSIPAEGRVVSPGAGATIATMTLPQGTYLIHWAVELDGAVAAAELNNMQLFYGGTGPLIADLPAAVGNFDQEDVTTVAPAGGLIVAVKAIAAGTVGVGYSADMSAIPTDDAVGQILDGGQLLAVVSLSPGASDTQGPGSRGVRFDTSVAVLTTTGQLSGVLYVADLRDPSGSP